MSAPTQHSYASATNIMPHLWNVNSNHVSLKVVQQPSVGRVAIGKEKDRKPIDPPPVVKLEISPHLDPNRDVLHSVCFIVTCNLLAPKESLENVPSGTSGTPLAGTVVSSLHRLRGGAAREENADGAFFIFSDISVKLEGKFKLQFNLYQMRTHENECRYVHSIVSDTFQVYSTKTWPGMSESTALTRAFSDQGVRLRLRKEPRALLKKRGPAADDYEPRHYKKAQTSRADRELMVESDPKQSSLQSASERHDSIDQSFTQTPNLTGRHYSQQSSSYIEVSQYEDHLAKRPRSGSMQSRVPSFSDGSSLTSPPMGGSGIFAESQQQAYDYGQPSQHAPQSGNSLLNWNAYALSSQTIPTPREQYFNRTLSQMVGQSHFDTGAQRPSTQLHHTQQTSRFPQQQYGMPSQPTQAPNPVMQQRQPSFSDSFDVYPFGMRQQAMGLPGSMPPPTLGRLNTSNLGIYGPQQGMVKPPYQSDLGQNATQNMSAGSMGGMFSLNRAPTTISSNGASIPETYS